MSKRISPDLEIQMVRDLQTGMSGAAVAKKYDYSFGIVCRIGRRHGIETANKKIDVEIEKKIAEECRNGATGAATAIKYEISKSSVTNILKKYGVPTKIGKTPTCAVNHEAFNTLTPESEYWMGFLFADGSINTTSRGTPAVVCNLSSKDRVHVEKLRTFLGSTHKISDVVIKTNLPNQTASEHRYSVQFRVRSQPLVDALRRRGFCLKGPDRTPTSDIEDSIDFWRGAVDGDGTVRVHHDPRRNYYYPQIILCGHMPLMEKFQAFLARRSLFCNIIDASSCIYQIRLMGAGALSVIKLLYANASVALDRKLATAHEILERFDQV